MRLMPSLSFQTQTQRERETTPLPALSPCRFTGSISLSLSPSFTLFLCVTLVSSPCDDLKSNRSSLQVAPPNLNSFVRWSFRGANKDLCCEIVECLHVIDCSSCPHWYQHNTNKHTHTHTYKYRHTPVQLLNPRQRHEPRSGSTRLPTTDNFLYNNFSLPTNNKSSYYNNSSNNNNTGTNNYNHKDA